ncbi:MAG TPA: hypothetical protein VK907_14475, partial [Phnomibacter sp.]|nr:hypothetical protein [Phnomibacter sp.]
MGKAITNEKGPEKKAQKSRNSGSKTEPKKATSKKVTQHVVSHDISKKGQPGEASSTSIAIPMKHVPYEQTHFVDTSGPVWNYSRFTPEDLQNYHQGTLYRAYELFGSHPMKVLDKHGYYFAVWAPNASSVSVIGPFNQWKPHKHELKPRLDQSGIWEGFIPDIAKGEAYKY